MALLAINLGPIDGFVYCHNRGGVDVDIGN